MLEHVLVHLLLLVVLYSLFLGCERSCKSTSCWSALCHVSGHGVLNTGSTRRSRSSRCETRDLANNLRRPATTATATGTTNVIIILRCVVGVWHSRWIRVLPVSWHDLAEIEWLKVYWTIKLCNSVLEHDLNTPRYSPKRVMHRSLSPTRAGA